MKFQNWLEHQGEYVHIQKLKRYVKNKEGEQFRTIEEEIIIALNDSPELIWVPTAV